MQVMQFMKIIKSYSPNTLISSSIVNQVNQALFILTQSKSSCSYTSKSLADLECYAFLFINNLQWLAWILRQQLHFQTLIPREEERPSSTKGEFGRSSTALFLKARDIYPFMRSYSKNTRKFLWPPGLLQHTRNPPTTGVGIVKHQPAGCL